MDPTSKSLWKQRPQDLNPPFSPPTPNGTWRDSSYLVNVDGAFLNHSVKTGWPKRPKNTTQDYGSNWSAIESSFNPTNVAIDVTCYPGFGDMAYGYRGPVIVHDASYFSSDDFVDLLNGSTTEVDLLAFGSTAISRVLPTNPLADLPTAIGELLSEGLPGIIGSQILRGGRISASRVADEYLNFEFGLKPFFRDFSAFVSAAQKANAILEQYARDSGKMIRRRYEPGPEISTFEDTLSTGGGYSLYLGGLAQSNASGFFKAVSSGWPGERVDRFTVERNRWFSGAFCYYLPKLDSGSLSELRRQYAEMRRVYGGLGASTVWNLLPYSWAADWFTNAGDLIRNLDAFSQDGLVMPYGYVMEHYKVQVVRTVSGIHCGFQTAGTTPPSTITSTFDVQSKRRRKATPFAFGTDATSLSLRQQSILGALGLSRLGS